MSRTISVSVDVDVYLSDIDTDDLVAELKSRGHEEVSGVTLQPDVDLQDIEVALKRNDRDYAWNLMVRYVEDKTGHILQ